MVVSIFPIYIYIYMYIYICMIFPFEILIMYMIFATAGLELALIWATLLNDSCTDVFRWSFAACGERKLEECVQQASLLRWTTLCEAMAMDDVLLENGAGLR